MIETTVTIRRGTGAINTQSIIASGIVAQIDQKSLSAQQFDGGAAPYILFDVYAWTSLMKTGDHLVDENNTSDIYTVSSPRVETFPDGHCETEATMPIGS